MDQDKTRKLCWYFTSLLVRPADDIREHPELFTSGDFVKKMDSLKDEYNKACNSAPGRCLTDGGRKKKSYYGILAREESVKLRAQTRNIRKEWE